MLPSSPANVPSSFEANAPSGIVIPASDNLVERLSMHPLCTAAALAPPCPTATEPILIISPIDKNSSSILIPSAAAAAALVP